MLQASDMGGFPKSGGDAVVTEPGGVTRIRGGLVIHGAAYNPYTSNTKLITLVGGTAGTTELFTITNSGVGNFLGNINVGGVSCQDGTIGSSGISGSTLNGKEILTFDGTDSIYKGYSNLILGVFDGTASYPGVITCLATGAVVFNRLPASVTPAANGELAIEATDNSTITFKLKGSDGTIRSGAVSLT